MHSVDYPSNTVLLLLTDLGAVLGLSCKHELVQVDALFN